MAEYIEREAILDAIAKDHSRRTDEEEKAALDIWDRIKKIPAADVVEVRHVKWVKDTRTADVCAEYRCSLCGFMYCETDPKYPPYKYCPECGAKNE